MTREEAISLRRKIERIAELQTDEDALTSIELFPKWKSDLFVSTGSRYQYNNKLYRVVQDHVTQSDWTPDITKALWTEVYLDEWPEWIQPTGAQDAYNTGDKVTYKSEHYISLIDNNVWSPEVYPSGWDKQ